VQQGPLSPFPALASRGSCRRSDISHHFARQPGQTVHPEANIQAIGADVDPLDDQRRNARLLGGEEFVPERIKADQRDLARKDRALAETAALLVLRKKLAAIWGQDEDV